MLKLISRDTTPPSGYRDICEATGFPFVADSLAQLIEKEKAHMKANNIPIPADLADQVENRLCHRMPKGICASTDGEFYKGGAARVPASTILNSTMTLCHGVTVEQEVAEKRALVCSQCPENVRHGGCQGCRGITQTLHGLLMGRTTRTDRFLQVCDVCGVFCKVLVWQQSPFSGSGLKRDGLWDRCWLNEA